MKNTTTTAPATILFGRMLRVLSLLLVVCWMTGCAGRVKDTSRTFTCVVIDAGHGGRDSGATSRWGGREKDHALNVAMRLRPRLESAGFRTVMTRRDDTFIPLDRRAAISNRQDNTIFVSIHFNHSPKRAVRGTEVYYHSRCSARVAQNILNQITALPGTVNRGVRTANFRVLRKAEYPAVLVECGYLSNPGEGSRCASGAWHERFAEAIARGIIIQRHGGVDALVVR